MQKENLNSTYPNILEQFQTANSIQHNRPINTTGVVEKLNGYYGREASAEKKKRKTTM